MIETARLARQSDVELVSQLAEEARREKVGVRGGAMYLAREAPSSPHDDRIAAAIESPAGEVVVGTIDEVVVGFATLRFEQLRTDETLGVIDELYVHAAAREVGVGEVMMDLLVGLARQHGCLGLDALALPGDRQTKNFFETFGLKARLITVHRALD